MGFNYMLVCWSERFDKLENQVLPPVSLAKPEYFDRLLAEWHLCRHWMDYFAGVGR